MIDPMTFIPARSPPRSGHFFVSAVTLAAGSDQTHDTGQPMQRQSSRRISSAMKSMNTRMRVGRC